MANTPRSIEKELKELIHKKLCHEKLTREKLRPLGNLARAAHMSPWKLYRWYNGRTAVLDVNNAERLWKALTGESLLK